MSKHIELIARGWLEESGRVLMCQNKAKKYFYLPGGHVEHGESSRSALAREFVEECGLRVEVANFLFACEASFIQKKKLVHELTVLFHVERKAGKQSIQSLEEDIAFEWLPIRSLAQYDIRPRELILTAKKTIKHRSKTEFVSIIS